MKQFVWLTVLFLGCAGAHVEARAHNALVGTEHQIALEVCVQNALAQAKDGGADMVEYRTCADAADKASGRK